MRYGAEDRRADRDRVHQTFEGARRGRFAEAKECDDEDDAATVTTPAALLSRAEFVAALIALARSADPGAPTLLDEAQDDNDVHGEGPKKTTRPAPASTIDALEVLATRHVAPLLARRRESVVACFDGAAIQDAVFERQAPLRRAFDHYADGDGMTLAGFGSVVRASSLGELVLADEEEGDRVLDDRCRAAFRGAQGAPAALALAAVFGEFPGAAPRPRTARGRWRAGHAARAGPCDLSAKPCWLCAMAGRPGLLRREAPARRLAPLPRVAR